MFLLDPFRFGGLWTPANTTTDLWLDAADATTITTVSGAVSQWNDKSGNARNASQSTPGNRPSYQATGFNGKPTVRFDGINDQLDLVQFAQVSGQQIFMVVDTSLIGSDFREAMGRTSAAADNLSILYGGDASASQSYRPCVYWNGTQRAVWGQAVQRKAMIRWGFNSGATALTQVDAATAVTQSFTASQLTNWNKICLSAIQQAAVDVSEIVVISSPSQDIVDRLYGYFAHNWSLTANLPSNHPYKSAAPTV